MKGKMNKKVLRTRRRERKTILSQHGKEYLVFRKVLEKEWEVKKGNWYDTESKFDKKVQLEQPHPAKRSKNGYPKESRWRHLLIR